MPCSIFICLIIFHSSIVTESLNTFSGLVSGQVNLKGERMAEGLLRVSILCLEMSETTSSLSSKLAVSNSHFTPQSEGEINSLSAVQPRRLVWRPLNLDGDTTPDVPLLDEVDGFVLFLQTRTVRQSQLPVNEGVTEEDRISPLGFTHIFPSLMISREFLTLSYRTTPTGVLTRNEPSIMSHPRMIGSRCANAWMMDRRTGQTASPIASRLRASITSPRYFWKASNRW